MTTPRSGNSGTHDLVLRFGNPSSPSYQGLMLPRRTGAPLPFTMERYNQFAPQIREGDQTDRDLSILSNWEQFKGLQGGIGTMFEPVAESDAYNMSVGVPAIYTAQTGRVLPPPSLTTIDTSRKDIKQFLECQFAGGAKYMALSNTNPGKVYYFDSTGTVLTDSSAGLTVGGNQMTFDGTTLRVTQGSSNSVRKTTDGTTWADDTAVGNADYIAIREGGVIAKVWVTGSRCQLVPDITSSTDNIYIGAGSTAATNMVAYKGALFIGTPQGLWRWANAHTGDSPFHDAKEFYSTSNCNLMAVHNNVLYYNLSNKLWLTDGTTYKEIDPKEIGGFISLDAMSATSGPLLFSAHTNPKDTGGYTQQSQLFYFGGVNDQGLNPLVASSSGTIQVTKNPATGADVAPGGTNASWTTPTNIYAYDSSYAYIPSVPPGVYGSPVTIISDQLQATNFGFSIPSNAVISGVAVEVSCYQTNNGSSAPTFYSAKLIKGGVVGGSNFSAVFIPVTEQYVKFGGSTSLAGNSLTYSDVNASNFGFELQIQISSTNYPGTYPGVYVNHVRMTVYYNVGSNTYAAVGSTRLFDSNGARIYFCESDTTNGSGVRYLNMNPRYAPLTYNTNTSANQYVELTAFSANLPSINKYFHDVIVKVRNPLSTSFVRLDYSTDRSNWYTLLDNTGASATSVAMSSENIGAYFPQNTYGTTVYIRIYFWTTDPSSASEIIRLTIRGLVMTKSLYQFTFPVLAEETVPGLVAEYQGVGADRGDDILANIKTAAGQYYPCDLQDLYGNWHRVVIKEPTPLVVPREFVVDNMGTTRVFSIIQLSCVEITPLTSTGALNSWAI
jgi:hypothetical protein